MGAYEKILKQPTPIRLKPQTDFSGSQIVDESTNYDRYYVDTTGENPIRPGDKMWGKLDKFFNRYHTKVPGTHGHPAGRAEKK